MNSSDSSEHTMPAVNPITRRNFMKKTALTAGAITLLGQGIGFANPSGSTHYMIKCVAWPNPAENSDTTYLNGSNDDRCYTTLYMTGAHQGQKASSFTIQVNAAATHTYRKLFDTTTTAVGVNEGMTIVLSLSGNTIQSTCTNGDGSDVNEDLELLISTCPLIQCKAYLVKKGWAITSGKIGWDKDGLNGEIVFSNGSTVLGSCGLGSAFTVVEVDENGNEK